MTHEQEATRQLRPAEVFGLTRDETLFYRITDARFQVLLNDDVTTVHAITLDANNYGEYLFVTLSREVDGKRAYITFYGMGYHEQREKWVIDEWYWYEQRSDNCHVHQTLNKAEANHIIQNRREVITADRWDTVPSERALLFSILANLVDEDAASIELDNWEARGLLWEDEEGGDYPF